jgi:transposase
MMLRLMLTDSLWSKISVLLPPDTGRRGRPSPKTRMIVEGILWRHRTGSPWRDVPDAFGPWPTVFSRFNRWSKVGVWQTLFSTVNKEADREWHFVDSTSIRAHQHGSGARKGIERAIGSSRGGPTTKIHNYDKAIYKSRHVIENLFAKMKQWRAVATRYEKNPANFMAVLHIVSAIIWLT